MKLTVGYCTIWKKQKIQEIREPLKEEVQEIKEQPHDTKRQKELKETAQQLTNILSEKEKELNKIKEKIQEMLSQKKTKNQNEEEFTLVDLKEVKEATNDLEGKLQRMKKEYHIKCRTVSTSASYKIIRGMRMEREQILANTTRLLDQNESLIDIKGEIAELQKQISLMSVRIRNKREENEELMYKIKDYKRDTLKLDQEISSEQTLDKREEDQQVIQEIKEKLEINVEVESHQPRPNSEMASSKQARMLPVVLDISKLNEIVQILKQYRFPEAKWFEFGLNLGLLYPTMEAIDANHRGNTSRCLMECLSKWLSETYENVYPPTWQTLASALRKLEAKAVAENIEKIMVSQLQHYSSRISGATLSEESVDLLHTEGLISEETLREVKSCGYTLTDDAMREIYTTVAYNHNKLKSFVKILLRSTGTASIANDLMRDGDEAIGDNCDEHNPSSIIAPNSVAELRVGITEFEFQISEEYNYQFDKMRGNFGTFYFKVTQLISHTIRVNQLEDFIEFLDDCYPELGPNLTSAATVKDVMKVIKTKCNVVNIAPVKKVVSFYSITEANRLISDYNKTLDEFCHTFKLQFLLDKKLSTSDFLICETIVFVLDWDPAEHLLNDIRRLMEKAFKGLCRRIIVKSMHKGN